jgi:hypothetical protein
MPALPEPEVHMETLPSGTTAAIAELFATSMGNGRGELHSQQILLA